MGVPKFYRWLSERYPCLSEVVKEHQIPEFDNFYLDMNGIIHPCSHPNDDDPHFRITEEIIFSNIFHYIEFLFRLIQPRKVFFMAVDGVAPRAKMNQQRGRRLRSAKEAEVNEKRALEKGEKLPTEARFDSNCITPGTPFMVNLHEQLKYFIAMKISTDKLWQNVKIILSGHETPGEGEHKIMDFIRYERSQPGYDPNIRHCLYGLDADLIMLGMCTHDPHFALLREEVKFRGRSKVKIPTPEETTFHLMHLSLLREYLDFEFSPLKDKLSFPYDAEKIYDDWVFMGFLVGNDFIPHLPDMHIHKGALHYLYQAYIELLPTLDGYINEGGYLNLGRFEKFMKKLSHFEAERFEETYVDLKWFQGKTGRKMNSAGSGRKTACSKQTDNILDALTNLYDDRQDEVLVEVSNNIHSEELEQLKEDTQKWIKEDGIMKESDADGENDSDSADESLVDLEFKQHKRDYYMNKLMYKNVTQEVLQEQAEGYVRAIQWNLHYYYNGVCSWSWYYPHHYAPFISDIKGITDLDIQFDLGKPFLPFQQLLAVLPAASKTLLPLPYQDLMTNENSPLIEYYPTEFETDLNGKAQDWEAVVLIPFIDETCLLEAMTPIDMQLTDEAKHRNKHGPMLVYTKSDVNLGPYKAPDYFPTIHKSYAKFIEVPREALYVEPSKLKKGLLENVRLDVYFPGFPTLKHIPHKAFLQKGGVKVFEMNSKGDTMMLEILDQGRPNIKEVADELLGKNIYVAWPHLTEAKVVSIANKENKYFLKDFRHGNRNDDVAVIPLSENKKNVWEGQMRSIRDRYRERMGVIIGDTSILVHACPITGRKYICGHGGKITLEKQWTQTSVPYALQTTVKDIAVKDPVFMQYRTLRELFSVGSNCFMLGLPCYGCMGEVVEADPKHNGRVRVRFMVPIEPHLGDIMKRQHEIMTHYMPGYIAAQRLGITSHLLSRITGSIFIIPDSKRGGNDNSKINIGFNMKSKKKNEEIPGWTKKTEDRWFYSVKTVDTLHEFQEKFPEVLHHLGDQLGSDIFQEADIFPNGNGAEKIQEILEWLKSLPFHGVGHQACGTEILDENVVMAIENQVQKVVQRKRKVNISVRPHLLFKPNAYQGCTPPDLDAIYHLFDRVTNVREGYAVPLGLRGTVIGIHKAEKQTDVVYDVVFDEDFTGGIKLRCSPNKGYKLPCSALINISHGLRQEEAKKVRDKPTAVVFPTGHYDNHSGSYKNADILPCSGGTQMPKLYNGHDNTQNRGPAVYCQSSGRGLLPPPLIGSTHYPPPSPFPSQLPPTNFQSFIRPFRQQGFQERFQEPSPYGCAVPFSVPPPFFPPFSSGQLPHEVHSHIPYTWDSSHQHRVQPEKPQAHQGPHDKPTSKFADNGYNSPRTSTKQKRQPHLKCQDKQEGQYKHHLPTVEFRETPRDGATKPNTEFIEIWQELQNKEKHKKPHPPSTDKLESKQKQQKQDVQKDSMDAFSADLQKMLKITSNNQTSTSTLSPHQGTPVSVTDLFKGAKSIQVQPPVEKNYCMDLLTCLQSSGLGVPCYNYIHDPLSSQVKAQVVLPDGCSFVGMNGNNRDEASSYAAKVALDSLQTSYQSVNHEVQSKKESLSQDKLLTALQHAPAEHPKYSSEHFTGDQHCNQGQGQSSKPYSTYQQQGQEQTCYNYAANQHLSQHEASWHSSDYRQPSEGYTKRGQMNAGKRENVHAGDYKDSHQKPYFQEGTDRAGSSQFQSRTTNQVKREATGSGSSSQQFVPMQVTKRQYPQKKDLKIIPLADTEEKPIVVVGEKTSSSTLSVETQEKNCIETSEKKQNKTSITHSKRRSRLAIKFPQQK